MIDYKSTTQVENKGSIVIYFKWLTPCMEKTNHCLFELYLNPYSRRCR